MPQAPACARCRIATRRACPRPAARADASTLDERVLRDVVGERAVTDGKRDSVDGTLMPLDDPPELRRIHSHVTYQGIERPISDQKTALDVQPLVIKALG
jgi:hypothetical protein